MTNDERRPEPTAATGSVTGVARGGHGTGTALDDTQVYDVAELTATPIEAAASEPAHEPAAPAATVAAPADAPAAPAPAMTAPSAMAVAPAEFHGEGPEHSTPVVTRWNPPRPAGEHPAASGGASVRPVAGIVGFAIAACLAIIVGASLGMTSDRGANADATFGAPATEAPGPTEANDGDEEGDGESGGNGKGNKGCKGNGRGNCDDD